MTVHEAVRGGHCAKPSCKRIALQRTTKRRDEETAAERAQRIAEVRSTLMPTLDLEPESVAIALVPANNSPVVKLTRNRKAAFRRHLVGLAAESSRQESAADIAPLPVDELPSAPQFDPESRAGQDGCAMCRGACCRPGATNHAFLDTVTLRRYRAATPQLSQRAIVAAYMNRIPESSVQNSCVFHGTAGCTLPRPMRAAICNVYHCADLVRMRPSLEDPNVRALLIVATSTAGLERWTVHHRTNEAH